MRISASWFPKYLDSLEFPVTLYEKNSKVPWKDADRRELELLVGMGLVFGAGTWTRLRRIFLSRPSEEVVAMLMDLPEEKHSHLDLDTLQRMISSRKTVFREHLFVVEDDVRIRSGHWCWAHKGM